MSKHAKGSAVKLFKSIDQSRIEASWFITNTLPRNFYCPIHEFKKVLERYFARLTRAYGDRLAWYWCMEPTKAGQWHLHMIAFWVKDAPTSRDRWKKFRDWNDRAWHLSTKCPDESHLKAGCRVEAARSWAGVTCYLAGYLSPEKWADYDGPDTGRVHGLRNGALLPINPESYELTPRASAMLRRAIARVRSKRASGVYWVDQSGKRERVPVPRSDARRVVVKALAEVASGHSDLKLKRIKARYFRNEIEWNDAFEVKANGREVHVGVVATRVDEYGRGVKSYAFGPSELHLPWQEAQRLVEWAIREDRRRSDSDLIAPF